MNDFRGYVEIAIFLMGWIAVLAAVRQGQRDLKDVVHELRKDLKRLSEEYGGLDRDVETHDEAIRVLQATAREQEILSNRHEKWIAVANNELRRIIGGWKPPNGDQ